MKVWCHACGTDDIPETFDVTIENADTTARDHLRIFHPDEWFTVDWAPDGITIYPSEFDGASDGD